MFGALALIKPLLDRSGIKESVDKYAPMERNGRTISNGEAVEVMIMNRLTSPTPLFRVEDWAERYALEEACAISPKEVNDDRLARALDAVYPRIEDIEADVSLRIMSHYHIKPELVHMDFTSLYFEGAYDDSDFLKLGYSRDQKPDKKQINIGIDVDASEGMPLFHDSYDGNTPDSKMAVENLKKIKDRLKPDHMILVGDRSAIDGEIALMLRDYKLDFIGAVKLTSKTKELVLSVSDDSFRELNIQTTSGAIKQGYTASQVSIEFSHDGRKIEVRGILVRSQSKADLDRRRREEALAWIKSKFEDLKKKLNQRRMKDPKFVSERIESILDKKKSYSRLFRTDLKGEYGKLSFDYNVDEEQLKKEPRLDGKYVLATTLRDWRSEKVVEAYRSRYVVESRIRNMKSNIAVRPVFLHSDERIRALAFMSVLSLMIYTLMEIIARRSKIRSVWGSGTSKNAPITANQLLYVFARISVIEHVLKDRSRLRLIEDLNPLQLQILRRTELPIPETYVKL
jgi:transposase